MKSYTFEDFKSLLKEFAERKHDRQKRIDYRTTDTERKRIDKKYNETWREFIDRYYYLCFIVNKLRQKFKYWEND